MSVSEVVRALAGKNPSDELEDAIRATVAALERKGVVVRVKGEKLSRIQFTDYQAGALAIRGEGRAWLLSGERGVPDIPIFKGAIGSALDGDFVLVRVEKEKGKGRVAGRAPRVMGRVLKVLVRRRETVVGKIARGPDGTVIVPFDKKIDALLKVPDGKDLDAPTGIYVEARILAYPDDKRLALAEVIETIGFEGEPGVDVEVVARKWGIPRVYPEAAMREAEQAVGEVDPNERRARADYTERVIVTIDGETARDFDDAIEAEQLPGGGFRLGIHIADVSHYVKPKTALDAEAYERGTSVYFPDRAIAMLPERLSNDLCSLRPHEERRTLSAILTLDKHGEPKKAEFTRSLIRSKQRLTYNRVGRFFELLDAAKGTSSLGELVGMAATQEIEPDSARMLLVARSAAALLRKRRTERGSLDFDLPDADVILGESGDVVEIVKAARNEAHRLIEEFMLAANEAVAKHLELLPTPAVYRVHDRPDESKLADLRVALEPFGYELPEDEEEITPEIFQRIIDEAAGTPEERFVSELVLRAQKKALYSPECRGHYALAAKYYCHFTSPIRRYPDLLVHRALAEWIATKRPPAAELAEARTKELTEASRVSSERERRAESAEREALAWKKFVFLSKRLNEEFDAYVSAVVPFGMFITLDEIYVDGLIPMDALEDDFYRYEEVEHRLVGASSGRVYRLGDLLRVKLTKVDFDRRELGFVPIGISAGPRRRSRVEAIQRRTTQRTARGGGRGPRRR
jgi:ribonuclease R